MKTDAVCYECIAHSENNSFILLLLFFILALNYVAHYYFGFSTMSTGLNTLSGTIYEDFIEPLLPNKPTERKASLILKFLVVAIGIVAVLLVTIVEKLGQLVEV